MANGGRHRGRIALVLALLIHALAFQGARGIWDPDEGRYTAAALEMIRLDNYRDVFLHHEIPHFTKPPLTYWLLAGSFRAFGTREWAARLPGALAFWGAALLLLALGERLVPRAPWAPAAIYATSLLPASAANIVTTDTILAFFELLAVWAFLRSRWAASVWSERAWIVALWAALGLAFLTKGPPGLLPLLPIALATWIRQGWPRALALVSGTGLLAFGLVGLGWYLVEVRTHPGLLAYFIGEEFVERVATGAHDRHAQWYGALRVYLPALGLGLLPWVRPAWWALRSAVRGTRPRPHPPLEGARLFPLLWFAVPLAVFFLARSRLPLYVLPLFAPLSILLAQAAFGARDLEEHPGRLARRRREIAATAAVAAVVLLGIRLAAGTFDTPRDARALAGAIRRDVPAGFGEVVRPGEPTRFGLVFYLGVEVEPVRLGPADDPPGRYAGPASHALETELAELGTERPLFVVSEENAPAFLRRAEAAGCVARERGRASGERFYTLRRAE